MTHAQNNGPNFLGAMLGYSAAVGAQARRRAVTHPEESEAERLAGAVNQVNERLDSCAESAIDLVIMAVVGWLTFVIEIFISSSCGVPIDGGTSLAELLIAGWTAIRVARMRHR